MASAAQAMIGSGNGSVVIASVSNVTSTGSLAANVMFNTDGSISYLSEGATTTLNGEWLLPNPNSGKAASYEIRRTQTSGVTGVTFTGTMTSGTWYPLTSQRGVSVAATTVARTNVSTWDIRAAGGDGTILASLSITVFGDI